VRCITPTGSARCFRKSRSGKGALARVRIAVTQFAELVELTVQRVYQLCQQNILPRIVDGNPSLIAGMQGCIR